MPRAKIVDENATRYVRELSVADFHETNLPLFWAFLCERQDIYIRRAHLQMDAPWSGDEVLSAEFITNVYRELDPGTKYLMEVLAETKNDKDKLLRVLAYRMMGSVPETFDAVKALMTLKNYDAEKFVRKVRKKASSSEHRVWGDAYRVASYYDEKGEDKIESVSRLLTKVVEQVPEWFRRMKNSPTAQDLFNVFVSIKGYGEFLAHQSMTDMLYLSENEDTKVFDFTTDEWAQPGPGARKGIWHLMAPSVKPSNLQVVVRWLADNQIAEFERLNLQFHALANPEGEPIWLSVANIQSCLCEFGKYLRVRTGERQVRKYDPSGNVIEAVPVIVAEDALEALRDLSSPWTSLVAPIEESALPEAPVGDSLQSETVVLGGTTVTITSNHAVRELHVVFRD